MKPTNTMPAPEVATLEESLAPRFELRAVKIARFASHETLCFTATIYVDGKRAATVENDGRGGSNNYHPIDRARFRELELFAEEWVLKREGIDTANVIGTGGCVDYYVDDVLMTAWEVERETNKLYRKSRRQAMVLASDGNIYTYKVPHEVIKDNPKYKASRSISALSELEAKRELRRWVRDQH